MRLLITSWGILSHSSRRALSSSCRFCGGGWQPATHLHRASQTCSIGFMSGEHAGNYIRTIPSTKSKSSTSVRDYNPSEDLIPISTSSRRSFSNDLEVCAPINGYVIIHQDSPTAKSDTFVHERRIIPTPPVPPDENTSIIRMNRKTGLVRKRTLLRSFLLQFTCSVVHSLRSRRCLDFSLTLTIGR
ncbi:uncharacterized protein TNCV_3647411 [Trichonephila clavipes]|nr:uncharacterized protein TNCV_3647411 [Trichonephila clavipes]